MTERLVSDSHGFKTRVDKRYGSFLLLIIIPLLPFSGPKDHAYFMGWVGLCYAISQGLLAKLLIKQSEEDPTVVVLACVAALSLGRVLAMWTTSLMVVYAIMAVVIVALGVMNTAMSSACSRLADADQVSIFSLNVAQSSSLH